MLPSGDVYSDLALMLQTWNFKNIDSLEMIGCRACFSKEEQDLLPTQKDCTTCITKNKMCRCGHFVSSLNKLLDIEDENRCENKKWAVGYKTNGSLEEGECDKNHYCCFETKNYLDKIENESNDKMYDKCRGYMFPTIHNPWFKYNGGPGSGCGFDVCEIYLDTIRQSSNKLIDLKSWRSEVGYDNEIRYGGKTCGLLRIYSLSMGIPMMINLLFSSVIFYSDLKSGVCSYCEALFLIVLLYPQWRTLKILIKFFHHKSEEQLTNSLDKNEKEVSFIEPFCESGLQVSNS